jgi:hypothetical protein
MENNCTDNKKDNGESCASEHTNQEEATEANIEKKKSCCGSCNWIIIALIIVCGCWLIYMLRK